jgi:hypothetical protein
LPLGQKAGMIRDMLKLTFVSTVVIAVLSGCGGQSASNPPAKQPTSDVDVEFHEPEAAETEGTDTDTGKSEVDQPEAAKPEAGKSEAGKSEAGKSGTDSKANAAKKGCAGLKQDICQITMGCAWSSKKVCVDQ